MIIYSFELESYFTFGEIGTTNYIRFKLTYKLQLKISNYIMYSVFDSDSTRLEWMILPTKVLPYLYL